MHIQAWTVEAVGKPMVHCERETLPAEREVLVEVAGCGVCHTDLGFFYDGVPTRSPFPLTLGHEISGTIVETGSGAGEWLGRKVVVPAVIPCGECDACLSGRAPICPRQIFPGSDVHGGFASHVCVPSRGLCEVPDLADPSVNPVGLQLHELSVIADAVSTPFQAIQRAGLGTGDLAVFVGVGGIGGFGVQIAAAIGATVVAVDIDDDRLATMLDFGADLTLNSAQMEFRQLRGAIREFSSKHEIPSWKHKIFETSGTTAGQATAFGLVSLGAYLSIVGFTAKKLELRLSNLMAFDAIAQGNWGCIPEHYPAIVDLVLSDRVKLKPFVERRPLSTINETFEDLHERRISRRVILVPE